MDKADRVRDMLLLEQEYVQTITDSLDASSADRAEAYARELADIRGTPLALGTLEEIIDDEHAIVSTTAGPDTYCAILSFVDPEQLEVGCTVLLHNKTSAVVGVLADEADPLVSVMKVDQAPTETFDDIGGLDDQVKEIKEAVELPLTHPELYEEVGITPPKGVILYGPPGTGKTLLAKAVANSTSATFLRVTGSELIQKYLGEGPRLVREMFRVAEEMAPTIIFLDEIDAVGTKREDSKSGGEREVQRTMLELLNQLDGFDNKAEIKVIMATNRIDALDPALIRPGRIDRKIELPLPDLATKKRIFAIHTKRMSLEPDVDVNDLIHNKDDLSGADIMALCTEAGLLALRERRMRVTMADFREAREKVIYKKEEGAPTELYS
jgi:26S proteasome regulatory subunit T2